MRTARRFCSLLVLGLLLGVACGNGAPTDDAASASQSLLSAGSAAAAYRVDVTVDITGSAPNNNLDPADPFKAAYIQNLTLTFVAASGVGCGAPYDNSWGSFVGQTFTGWGTTKVDAQGVTILNWSARNPTTFRPVVLSVNDATATRTPTYIEFSDAKAFIKEDMVPVRTDYACVRFRMTATPL